MTCKECIHERVCDALCKGGLPYADGEYPAEAFCMAFRHKTKFVEVVRCYQCKYTKRYSERKGDFDAFFDVSDRCRLCKNC